MDLQPNSDPELTIVSTTNNAESTQYAGTFFPGGSGFTIGGGVFTSNVTTHVHNPPKETLAAFRTFHLGDINLIKEIHLNGQSGVVGRERWRAGVRRMYSAKLGDRRMTIAMYQGDGAEEKWRQHIAEYESIRHPHIMQLYGLASTRGLYVMVFYDELIPFKQFIQHFQHSAILTAYIRGYCCTEFNDACHYLRCSPQIVFSYSSLWIRPSTRNLCLDFFHASGLDAELYWLGFVKGPHLEDVSLDDSNAEAVIVSTLSEDEYHELCSWPPIAQYRHLFVSTRLPIRLGSIFRSNSQEGTLFRIAEPFSINLETSISWEGVGDKAEVLPNGWIRYDSHQVRDLHLEILLWSDPNSGKFWLAQANSIFTQLQETSHFDHYVCLNLIEFCLGCFPNTHNNPEPEGYLFVCPAEDFRTEPALFRWPDCPAYWSMEPSGTTRLSTEDAKALGFPVIHIETVISGRTWDKSVYDGPRQFHRGKGFDPDSRDVAKHLGYSLYTLSSEVDAPWPCGELAGCGIWAWGDEARCHTLGHYLNNSTTSDPTAESTSPDAIFASEDAPVDPIVPHPPAKSTKLILSTRHSSFTFFVLGTAFALSLLPTVT